jgi:hypothetical protein
MTDFDAAKNNAIRDHAAWSAKEREKLSKNPEAIEKAIASGAIYSLTAVDRTAIIKIYGKTPLPAKPRRPVHRPRRPQPMEAASKRFKPRQPWAKGEFAYACKNAAAWWCGVIVVGFIILATLQALRLP